MTIDQKIEEALQLYFKCNPYAKDWLTIKKAIILILPPSLRSQFTKRNNSTKKQETPNELELFLMQRWVEITERSLIYIDNEKEHKINPS